ncbi:MAG: hypothetical protein KGV43_02100 [Arcobacter sp.]|nr:hypothetical protein [Arcobacter sp.]
MEIIKNSIILFFIVVGFIGCSNSVQPKKQDIDVNKSKLSKKEKKFISGEYKSAKLSIKNINGILMVFEDGKEYILSSKGIEYKPHLSSNKENLVLDILLPNNLSTIAIYHKDYKFKKVKYKFKRKVLEDFLKKHNYLLKDISFFELKFFDWVDNDTFEFIISGEHKNKVFEEKRRFDILKK